MDKSTGRLDVGEHHLFVLFDVAHDGDMLRHLPSAKADLLAYVAQKKLTAREAPPLPPDNPLAYRYAAIEEPYRVIVQFVPFPEDGKTFWLGRVDTIAR